MTLADIEKIITGQTGVLLPDMQKARTGSAFNAKCLMVTLSSAIGFKPLKIANHMGLKRPNVYHLIRRGQFLLSTLPGRKDYDANFKRNYLSSMGQLAEMEDAA